MKNGRGLIMPLAIDDERKVRLSVPAFLTVLLMVGSTGAWLISLSYQMGAQENRLAVVERSGIEANIERKEIRSVLAFLRESNVRIETLLSERAFKDK